MLLPFDPAITFLRIYPMKVKTHIHTKMCPWMFIEALVIIAIQRVMDKHSVHPDRGILFSTEKK